MKVLASCSSYVLGQLHGVRVASRLLSESVAGMHGEGPVPATHALRLLRTLVDTVELHVDGGSTYLGRMRCRFFSSALDSDAAVWLSIDDDVDTTRETLADLLEAVTGVTPRVCVAPYVLRRDPTVAAVEFSPIFRTRTLTSGTRLRPITRAGFGLVAMNRAALQAIAEVSPHFRDIDTDGKLKPAPFSDIFEPGGLWLGDDFAFFKRLPRSVEAEALLRGETTHAGYRLDFSVLEKAP